MHHGLNQGTSVNHGVTMVDILVIGSSMDERKCTMVSTMAQCCSPWYKPLLYYMEIHHGLNHNKAGVIAVLLRSTYMQVHNAIMMLVASW